MVAVDGARKAVEILSVRISTWSLFLSGHQSAPSKCSDPRDPGLPGERPGGEGPEETLQPSCEESAAGRVPQGELCRSSRDFRPLMI